MGRSQVLYNRTKGRYKNNRGAGAGAGRGGQRNEGSGDNSNSHGKNRHPRERYHRESDGDFHDSAVDHSGQQQRQEQQQRRQRKSQVDESMILLADASMSGQRSYYYDRAKKEKEEKDATAFSILKTGGSINVPSMAATFQTMKRFERLHIPEHVVALAFQKPSDHDAVDDRNRGETALSNKGSIGAVQEEDDDEMSYTSYTIVGTRDRATELKDGQVEVRPKPREGLPYAKSDNLPTSASISAAASTASSKESKKKHIIMQMVSEDGSKEDKYMVVQASSSEGAGEDYTEAMNFQKKSAPVKNALDSYETNALDSWLDNSILESKDDPPETKTKSAQNATPPATPTPKGAISHIKKSKAPSQTKLSTANRAGKEGASKNDEAPKSPFNRHQQRNRSHGKEQNAFPGSVSSEDADEEAVRKAATSSYDVYSVDSGGEMFDDSDTEGHTRNNREGPQTAAKKNAMRDYVVNTTHIRKPSATAMAQETGEEEGEDLDDWLDSVIE
ncbi:MAG: hypothetical protein SGILL_000347 [Bacillariaceae sp.]